MNAEITPALPPPLEAVRRQFAEWRKTHTLRSRIPEALWTAAAKVAGTYGLHRTARALPVEYYSLKKRVERRSAAARKRHKPGPAADFVELPPPAPTGACDCTLELEDAAGSKMRVHLRAATPPDLAALGRSFWDRGP